MEGVFSNGQTIINAMKELKSKLCVKVLANQADKVDICFQTLRPGLSRATLRTQIRKT